VEAREDHFSRGRRANVLVWLVWGWGGEGGGDREFKYEKGGKVSNLGDNSWGTWMT